MSGPRKPTLRILGTRGIPASHGGFETFAEDLALHLVGRGWDVTVYCQEHGDGPLVESHWQGVRLIHIPVPSTGSFSTIQFDWRSTRHAAREPGLALVLGYNTAFMSALYRFRRIPSVLNLDGLEWKRAKYNPLERAWFWVNERLAGWLSDHLIADHPEIARRAAPNRWGRSGIHDPIRRP